MAFFPHLAGGLMENIWFLFDGYNVYNKTVCLLQIKDCAHSSRVHILVESVNVFSFVFRCCWSLCLRTEHAHLSYISFVPALYEWIWFEDGVNSLDTSFVILATKFFAQLSRILVCLINFQVIRRHERWQ